MDFHFVQALHETRELAARHADEPGWDDLRARVDRVLARLGEGNSDPTQEPVGFDRIDRAAIDTGEAERAAAALMAVQDREDDEQLELAREALEDLEDSLT